MFEKGLGLEFFISKTGSWIPVIDGTLLHSSINPEKEARVQVESEWPNLCEARSVIVLGLGGGFHISEMLARKPFQIVVIEANRELILAMEDKNPSLMDKIEVLGGIPIDKLSIEPSIQNAFSHSFAIFKHPASVRVSNYYYAAVAKILTERTIGGLRRMAEGNQNISRFLDSLDISRDQILTLPMVEEAISRRGTGLDREGLIWMTLRELIT